jgi:hypothetical protein
LKAATVIALYSRSQAMLPYSCSRYVFRTFEPESVRALVQQLIEVHCGELQKHVANNDIVRHFPIVLIAVGTVDHFTVASVSLIPQHPFGELR